MFCLEELFYNKFIVMYLNNEIVFQFIFYYIKEGFGLKIGFFDLYFYVGKLNEEEVMYLGLKEGDFKLFIEMFFYLVNGQLFDFLKVMYNYE